MNDEQKEYIVTQIEKYDDISKDAMVKITINCICTFVLIIINRANVSGLPNNVETFINQVLYDVSLLGFPITVFTFFINCIKGLYSSLMGKILTKKIENCEKEEIKEGKRR